jgi:glycosyltransferase involved in cell wall biosynthesis
VRPTVCHLLDRHACWEHRVALGQLLDRLPESRYRQIVAAIDPGAARQLGPIGRPIHRLSSVPGIKPLLAAIVSRFLCSQGVDVVHAWGPDAAGAALASPALPLAVELFDPNLAAATARLSRTAERPAELAIIAAAEWVRRRLVEHGVSPAQCTVIRPGVDFALLNSARKRPLRSELGLSEGDYVILVTEPVTRSGGQLDAFWAGALLNHVQHHVRVIVPGPPAGQDGIARFAGNLPGEGALIRPGAGFAFEQLLPHVDVLVVAPDGDASTTAIAWAMAAKVPVIGSAVHAVTELIAHRVGGLLFKRTPGRLNPVPLVRLLRDRPGQQKVREAAHGMAFESFGLRRFVDEHAALYDRLMQAGAASGSSAGRASLAGA